VTAREQERGGGKEDGQVFDRDNDPEAFFTMTTLRRRALQFWILLALRRSRSVGSANCGFSYSLKHRAEEALGMSISNGQLKGAMLAQGFEHHKADELNWNFNADQRCPHRMGAQGRARCPFDGRFVAIDYGRVPALCQATAEEFALFVWLRAMVHNERRARETAS
jgi:hypothetical protein